jgi:hypothetical protein
MAEIHLGSINEGIRYRVVVFQPGTFMSTALNEPQRLAIAVFATPGAEMSKLRVSRVFENPEPTDDYEMESFLPCDANTTRALLATGFKWDEEAREYAEKFKVSPAEVDETEREIVRLFERQVARRAQWMERRVGAPPVAPWE